MQVGQVSCANSWATATLIHRARITEPERCARRTTQLLAQPYRASPHWRDLHTHLGPIAELFATTDRTGQIAEASTCLLLRLLGWTGIVLHSSHLNPRPGRSRRLADLATTVQAGTYLCGTGGTWCTGVVAAGSCRVSAGSCCRPGSLPNLPGPDKGPAFR